MVRPFIANKDKQVYAVYQSTVRDRRGRETVKTDLEKKRKTTKK